MGKFQGAPVVLVNEHASLPWEVDLQLPQRWLYLQAGLSHLPC